jgi:outer membrane protein TolC
VAAEYAVPLAEQVPDHVPPSQPAAAAPAAPAYGLAALIDISLTNNPATRAAWQRARAAAASYGASRAAYYPRLTAAAPAGYSRRLEELPGKSGVVKEWYAEPVLQPPTLLDSGRRGRRRGRARSKPPRTCLDRELQTVVTTPSAAYALAAAKAAVAAEENLARRPTTRPCRTASNSVWQPNPPCCWPASASPSPSSICQRPTVVREGQPASR